MQIQSLTKNESQKNDNSYQIKNEELKKYILSNNEKLRYFENKPGKKLLRFIVEKD